jgi:hypothetical protein
MKGSQVQNANALMTIRNQSIKESTKMSSDQRSKEMQLKVRTHLTFQDQK